MTTYLRGPGLALALAPVTLALLLAGGNARAGLIISFQQSGADVVASESGAIDLTGLTLLGPSKNGPEVIPNQAFVVMGTPTVSLPNDIYSGITGPASFGGGPAAVPTSGSGDVTLLWGPPHLIIGVPIGYVSGSSLTSTDTYSGTTLAGIGLISGTYTYTWGAGGPAHTITVQVGPTAVPEPSTTLLAVIGAGCVIAYGHIHKRRANRRREALVVFDR